jgi:hypothetical protein
MRRPTSGCPSRGESSARVVHAEELGNGVAQDPAVWRCANIPDFGGDQKLAEKFWIMFRQGLVHEGRIKAFGQFSLDFPKLLTRPVDIFRISCVHPKKISERLGHSSIQLTIDMYGHLCELPK